LEGIETQSESKVTMNNLKVVMAVSLLCQLAICGVTAQQPTGTASKQLTNVAKDTAGFDGGRGSTINTSTRTTTSVPSVQTSSGTASGASASSGTITSTQRQEQAIKNYQNSGPAAPPQIQKASRESIHPKAPPPAPSKSNAPAPSGSVPTK
jgi:hypothetical protein